MDRFSAFGEFTYNLDVATSSTAVQRALARLLESLGFEFFMYSVHPTDAAVISGTGQDLMLTNFPPNWVDHYVKENYARIDPILESVVRGNKSCHWDPLIASTVLTQEQQRLKADAYSARISNGITLKIGSRHGEFPTLIAIPARVACVNSADLAELEPVLGLVGNYFHTKALDILLREKLAAQSHSPVKSLSPRERQVLYWASMGKTGWETGTILGISQKSVEVHADNAKNKLFATNKTHAVAKAILSGIIPNSRVAGDFTQFTWKMDFRDQAQNSHLAH